MPYGDLLTNTLPPILAASDFLRWLDRAPGLGLSAMVVLILAGLVLAILGGRLAKTGVALGGMFLGAILGATVAPWLGGASLWWLLCILGGVAGLLLATLLYRVWMALAMALILSLTAASGVLIWRGAPLPPVQGVRQIASELQRDFQDGAMDDPRTHATLQSFAERESRAVEQWWSDLGPTGQRNLTFATLGAAALGVVVGLLGPTLAAMLQAALVGGLLLLAGSRGLLILLLPEQMSRLRAGPRAWLILLGLITLVSLLIQWAIRPRKADKP